MRYFAIISVTILILVLALFLIGWWLSEDKSYPALRFVTLYALENGLSPKLIQVNSEGFIADLNPIQFEYKNGGPLIMRSVIVNNAEKMLEDSNQDMRDELRRVEVEEPDSIIGSRFEIIDLAWDNYSKPSLYLRKLIHDFNISDDNFLEMANKLSLTAYQWHRTYFHELAQRVIKKR